MTDMEGRLRDLVDKATVFFEDGVQGIRAKILEEGGPSVEVRHSIFIQTCPGEMRGSHKWHYDEAVAAFEQMEANLRENADRIASFRASLKV